MGIRSVAIAVPTSLGTTGAIAPVSMMNPGPRYFIVTGTALDSISVNGYSTDAGLQKRTLPANMPIELQNAGPIVIGPITDPSLSYSVTRNVGTTAMVVYAIGHDDAQSGDILMTGTFASRPAASASLVGVFYMATDVNQDGTTYLCVGPLGGVYAWVGLGAVDNGSIVRTAFTQPALGTPVTIDVYSTFQYTLGEYFAIDNVGTYKVTSNGGPGTTLTVVLVRYADAAPPTTVIPAGSALCRTGRGGTVASGLKTLVNGAVTIPAGDLRMSLLATDEIHLTAGPKNASTALGRLCYVTPSNGNTTFDVTAQKLDASGTETGDQSTFSWSVVRYVDA